MTRVVTLSYEDAVLLAGLVQELYLPRWTLAPDETDALTRFADALDEAEAPEPSGLFPEPYIVGPSGLRYRARSRAEDADD